MSGQELSPKRLQRSIARSVKVAHWHKGTFLAESLPRLRKLSLRLFREGMTTTGEDLIRLSKAYSDLCEQRRSLLGFPSPGRRRDESAEKLATAASNMPTEVESVTTGPGHDDATTTTQRDDATTPAAQSSAPVTTPIGPGPGPGPGHDARSVAGAESNPS